MFQHQPPILRNPSTSIVSSSLSVNGDAQMLSQPVRPPPLINLIGSTPSKSMVQVVAYQLVHEGEFKYIKNGTNFSILDSVEIHNPVLIPSGERLEVPFLRFNLREIQDFRVVRDSGKKASQPNEKKKKPEVDRTKPIELHLSTVVIHTAAQLKNFAQILRDVDLLGVSFEGQNVCRSGQVSWIILTARKTLIPLDVLSLTKEVPTFWDTLKKTIFENKKLLKIFHDCRPAADYLFHKHKIELINVFDTQIADAVVVRNATGFHPAGLRSLSDILPIYNTRIPPEEIEYLKLYEGFDYTQDSPWMEKPIPRPTVLKYGALKVKHLIPLRDNLLKKMIIRFSKAVQAHTEIFKHPDSVFQLKNPHTVPENLEAILVEEPCEFVNEMGK